MKIGSPLSGTCPERAERVEGYAHTCTVSTPESPSAARSAAQPARKNGWPTTCCTPGVSITVCGPTRLLPCGLSTTRTSCRATTCPPDHRTNTRSYVPTKPTPGSDTHL